MNEIEAMFTKVSRQGAVGLPVVPRMYFTSKGGHEVNSDVLVLQLGRQRPLGLANYVKFVSIPIQVFEDLKHHPLNTAQERKHLDMTDSNHRTMVG